MNVGDPGATVQRIVAIGIPLLAAGCDEPPAPSSRRTEPASLTRLLGMDEIPLDHAAVELAEPPPASGSSVRRLRVRSEFAEEFFPARDGWEWGGIEVSDATPGAIVVAGVVDARRGQLLTQVELPLRAGRAALLVAIWLPTIAEDSNGAWALFLEACSAVRSLRRGAVAFDSLRVLRRTLLTEWLVPPPAVRERRAAFSKIELFRPAPEGAADPWIPTSSRTQIRIWSWNGPQSAERASEWYDHRFCNVVNTGVSTVPVDRTLSGEIEHWPQPVLAADFEIRPSPE